MNKQTLIEFSKKIADLYNQGKIKSPIHLSGGNEDELIKIFKKVGKEDWIFSTHRSHFHWLLSGRSSDVLYKLILDGHSMHIFDNKFFTSAIVSGVAPIALGVAKALAMKGSKDKVWCFLGDMSGSGGLVYECIKYAEGFDLPITYVIEDNEFSVNALTSKTWGNKKGKNKVITYSYKRTYQHAGSTKEGEERKYVMF